MRSSIILAATAHAMLFMTAMSAPLSASSDAIKRSVVGDLSGFAGTGGAIADQAAKNSVPVLGTANAGATTAEDKALKAVTDLGKAAIEKVPAPNP